MARWLHRRPRAPFAPGGHSLGSRSTAPGSGFPDKARDLSPPVFPPAGSRPGQSRARPGSPWRHGRTSLASKPTAGRAAPSVGPMGSQRPRCSICMPTSTRRSPCITTVTGQAAGSLASRAPTECGERRLRCGMPSSPRKPNQGQDEKEYEEQTALAISQLFVAMTRARDGLFLLCSGDPTPVLDGALERFEVIDS